MKLDDEIKNAYDSLKSVKAVRKKTGYSWNRIVKSLSTSGIVVKETHALILKYHKKGMSPSEIANAVGLSVKTVQAYLPRTRPVYGEDLSENALRIRKSREKHKQEIS